MGTVISNVDYDEMKKEAQTMNEYGKDFQSAFKSAYEDVTEMHKDWYGKRYNTLCTDFNNILNDVNSMIHLTVFELPDALDKIACNYARANEDAMSNTTYSEPGKIGDITIIDDGTNVRFMYDNVTSTKGKVLGLLSDAESAMDSMNSTLTTLEKTWQSDAASAFRTKFDSLKSNVNSAISNIEKDFTNLMAAALDDMSNAENANTVG